MAQIDFFDDGKPIEETFTHVAKRLKERLNQALAKEIGLARGEAADKRDVDGFRFLLG